MSLFFEGDRRRSEGGNYCTSVVALKGLNLQRSIVSKRYFFMGKGDRSERKRWYQTRLR